MNKQELTIECVVGVRSENKHLPIDAKTMRLLNTGLSLRQKASMKTITNAWQYYQIQELQKLFRNLLL